MREQQTMLEVKDVNKYFGGLAALKNLSFEIYEGEIAGLIGPNGAGKTTLFNVLTGVLGSDSGMILFNGADITKSQAHQITHLGLARTFQLIRAFSKMTVLENVVLGGIFGHNKSRAAATDDALKYIDFVKLTDCADLKAANLTPYDQKKIELAAALNTEPKLVLLDEFVAGLNDSELNDAIDLTSRIRSELGITVFWIEHVMKAIMSVAERIIVINYGEKIAEGSPSEIAHDKDVIAAYLGTEYSEEFGDSAESE